MPLLLRVYGIRPWELDLFTGRELEEIDGDLRRLIGGSGG